jgi:hypothetical protein
MAIIKNRSTENGDVLYIKTDIPIIGIIALLSFVDNTQNETANTYFTKEFRYSVDGVNYSSFVPLTLISVSDIEINSTDTLYLEYRYTRVGEESVSLIFNEVTINGLVEVATPGPAWADSIFADYLDYNSICSISWSVNVLEKLYRKGIIPEYIERGKTGENSDDRDYIDFWRAVTHYYALYVCLARYFKTFYTQPELLKEFLRQRGMFICQEQDYEDMLYLMSYYHDEIRQRGTIQIVKRKGFTDRFNTDQGSISDSQSQSYSGSESYSENHPVIDIKEVDGEYLRLICNNPLDEFIFNINKNEHIGWNLKWSSPLYRGLRGRLNCNKFYPDFFNYLWQIELTGLQHIDLAQQGQINALKIFSPPDGSKAGLGKESGTVANKIVVNNKISYELTFQIKKQGVISGITVGCLAFDKNGNNVSLLSTITGSSNYFFQQKNLTQDDKYYFISCIIHGTNTLLPYSVLNTYPKDQIVKTGGSSYYKAKKNVPTGILISNTVYWEPLTSQQLQFFLFPNLSPGVGFRNLQMTSRVVKIAPFVLLDNSTLENGSIYIHSVRLTPLNTEYSKGFLQSSNMIEIWNVNNNGSQSELDIVQNSQRYLFPYSCFNKINFLDKTI